MSEFRACLGCLHASTQEAPLAQNTISGSQQGLEDQPSCACWSVFQLHLSPHSPGSLSSFHTVLHLPQLYSSHPSHVLIPWMFFLLFVLMSVLLPTPTSVFRKALSGLTSQVKFLCSRLPCVAFPHVLIAIGISHSLA